MLHNAFLAFSGTFIYPTALKALISQNKLNSGKAAMDIISNIVELMSEGQSPEEENNI